MKSFARVLLAVQALMVVVLGIATFLLEHRLELLNQSRDRAFASYLLADELRQSSDDLSRLARSFVATGDPEFEREYWAVLDIRAGKRPRPREYHRIYWDLVTQAEPEPRPAGATAALRQLMLAEGFTPAEFHKLDEAERSSDQLVHTETVAMNAAKGQFDDGSGQFSEKRAPDLALATRLLHDEAYQEGKRRVMRPIDEFFGMFEARTSGAVAEQLSRSQSLLRWLILLLSATLALFLGSFAALLRQSAEREQAQRALAASEARYRTIFQTAMDGFSLVDNQSRLLEVNDAFCAMVGYSAEELRTMRVSDLESQEADAGFEQHLGHARQQSDDRFSTRLRRKDGAALDVEVSTQYRPIDSGRFVIIMRDVSELKQAQAARLESDEILRSAFAATPAAIWVSSGVEIGRCIAVNEAFEKNTGYAQDEVLGKTAAEVNLYEDPEARSRYLALLRDAGGFRDFALRFRRKDGELRDGLLNGQVSQESGKNYTVAVLTDVTDAKRAERELKQLLRFETLMANLASSFLNARDDDLDRLLHDALRRMCDCFGLDRASIWQPEDGNPDRVVRTHLFAFDEPPPAGDKPAPVLREFPWLLEQLVTTDKTVIVPDVNALPDMAKNEREQLTARGVTNTVSIPWCSSPGKLDCAINFSSKRSRQLDPTEISQLETLSQMILVALSRAREQREKAAGRERMRALTEMLDEAPAGVMVSDQRGNFYYANKHALAMHGYRAEELAGVTIADLVVPEAQDEAVLRRKTILETGACAFNIWHQRKDESRVHIAAHVRISTWQGRPAFLSVLTDLSEREQAADALRQSEERYRLLAENISDVIWVLNLESDRFEYVSPSVLRLRGYTAEEATGQPLDSALTPESVTHARRRIAQLLEAESAGREAEAPEGDEGVVFYQIHKNGSHVPTDVRARILRDPASGKPLLLGVARDITERMKAEKERQDLQQQLYQSQKMEAVGGLAGGVAHDFNNLLSVITSYTDFVLDKLPEDDRRHADLLEVQKASERAIGLVRQLLAFSRKQILEPRVIDLNRVVSDVEKMLRRLLGEDIELEVKLARDLGTVLADAGQVEQVIMNLVVNARDAMPKGGRLTIETANVEVDESGAPSPARVKPGRYVSFAIADSGSGMDEATLARAFEPFFTTKRIGKGTGLGLSTVYGIIKQSDGEVQVKSQPGIGTTFSVYLPRKDAPLAEPPLKARSVAKSGNETVLIVEDEDGIRALTARILRNAGYTVLAAENGGEALALVEKHTGKVDLLLTDVVMPQMSGRQIAERLASIQPGLKVLYMSGYTDEIIDHHGVLDAGMRLIGKPFVAADMTRKVRAVLDEGREPG
ncbi:MAG TPA: PAS domain S-box protein [Polyangiaceae bacterium]|nr:PAS domain S-box protein [Polyangiaceae bacterium]